MEKLQMCRICLAKNVRMHIVVNRNLHELYEKLTNIPFVTEDTRPILACFFCCTKLKQCYRLLKKCLEAEEFFAQMMKEDYEPNSLINQHQSFSGFINSPIECISIVDGCQTESIVIKKVLRPAVCDAQDDIIEPKEEHQSDELELDNLDNSCDVADIPPYQCEVDLNDDEPLMEFKIEVEEEQEVSKQNQRVPQMDKLEQDNLDNSCDVADIPSYQYGLDLKDDVPLMELKTEVEEQKVSHNRRDTETESTSINCTFSRVHFFDIWLDVTGSITKKHQHALDTILASLGDVEYLDIRNLDNRILSLCKSLHRFWKIVSRNKSRFVLKYSDWLSEIECIELVRSNRQCIQENANQPGPGRGRRRPKKDFSELSKRARRI